VEKVNVKENSVAVEEIDDRTFPRSACVLVEKPANRKRWITEDPHPEKTAQWIRESEQWKADQRDRTFV
jgi:hypothetical protein